MEQETETTNKMYLGDGVYVEILGGIIRLSVGAIGTTRINLGVNSWNNLLEYVDAKLDY